MSNLSQKPPVWFWIIGVLALVWNAMGVNAYLQQAYNTESYREMYTPEQLDIAANMPAWVTGAFAVAVFSGALASLLLLLKKKLAKPLFLLSLLAVLTQMGYTIIKGYTDSMVMAIIVIAAAVLLYLFAKHATKKSWIH
ncbi:hypothetical protein [Winogradskyella poriferorum]|uniref:hypothetical protein n=1 Tax=Winogradskyella poriferorum TaxID=307627 RepID=UPI003D65A1E0